MNTEEEEVRGYMKKLQAEMRTMKTKKKEKNGWKKETKSFQTKRDL